MKEIIPTSEKPIENNQQTDGDQDDEPTFQKTETAKPKKSLPAKKIKTNKQFELLRAFAIASTNDMNLVTIGGVAKIAGIHQNSISICNPFFNEIGLIEKQGKKFKPSKELIDLKDSYQWDPENAGNKIAPIIKKAWFAKTILQKLSMGSFPETEALRLLAEECSATKEYRSQLKMLIDYLIFSGLVERQNNNLILVTSTSKFKENDSGPDTNSGNNGTKDDSSDIGASEYETFQIPIPGKESASIKIPKGLENEDWEMLKEMIDAYISRLKKSTGDIE